MNHATTSPDGAKHYAALLMQLLTVGSLLLLQSLALASPRPPQPPWPEQNLAAFGWDSPYERVPWRGIALGEESALLRESWSGYALTRDALTVEPVVIPVRDAAGQPVVASNEGAIRFWFCPDWSSADLGGKGPGGYARLLELVHWGGKGPETKWSLYVSEDGGAIYLSGQGVAGAQDFLKAGVGFQAGEWRLITVSYSTSNTVLYVDAERVSEGAALLPVAEWELPQLGLVVGSDALAGNPANGQFEELTMFDQWWRNEPWQKLYFKGTGRVAWLGPLGTREEEAAKHALQTEMQIMTLQDGPPEPGEGEPGEDPGNEVPGAYGYTNGLWLEITGVSNGLAYVTIHGTIEDEVYELRSKESLEDVGWVSEGVIDGAAGQDWTPATVVMGVRTNSLFLAARTWIDSEGQGLPDWWQLEHFGYVGVNPYADPDGDGWSNLQEFINRTSPNFFNTPQAPPGFSVRYNITNNAVEINWGPSPGPVTGYVVVRHIVEINQTDVFTFSTNTTGFMDTFPLSDPDPWYGPYYEIYGQYSAGNSHSTERGIYDKRLAVLGRLVTKSAGGSGLVIPAGLSTNTAIVRLNRYYFDWDIFDVIRSVFDVGAAEFTNGVASVPQSWFEPVKDYFWSIQALTIDGIASTMTWIDDGTVPFFGFPAVLSGGGFVG